MVEKSRKEELLGLGEELIKRGMGLYGRDKISQLAFNSGLALLDDDTVDWLESDKDPEEIITKFLAEYAKINLPARMTAVVYARKYNIKLPEGIRKKSRISRIRRWFKKD